MLLTLVVLALGCQQTAAKIQLSDPGAAENRAAKILSVFNVISFPNDVCNSASGLNGTCFTSSECETKGGSSSGTCAQSFGVCCVFSLPCGGSSSANNSYAVINSFSVSGDADPCTYTFCKASSDICKLKIEFTSMVLADPVTYASGTAATAILLGYSLGDCNTDTLTVTNPGGHVPPIICGYNTGQHMWVPASDDCNQINIDIATGSTATTRSWNIKVSQYTCGNEAAPDYDCLQYHTAISGTTASFAWDTSATTVAQKQTHLSHQYYDVCFRRARGYCSICYDPHIIGANAASSYGLGANAVATNAQATIGTIVTGNTVLTPTEASNVGLGDYLEIVAMQIPTGTAPVITGHPKISGVMFSAAGGATLTAQATICSFARPFRLGVHFDGDEATFEPCTAANADHYETCSFTPAGGGFGFHGFYLNYFQKTC